MLSFVFVSIDSLQPMLLQQKFNINKSENIENFKNSFVIAFDIIVKLFSAPLMGYMADKYGRQRVNLYGILIISFTMGVMPYATEFYQYVILRCIYATGAIAISVIPLLADYVNHKSRGTCAAILVFMSSIGALSSAFLNFTILSKLESSYKIYIQYNTAAVLILSIGLFYTLFALKPGNEYYTSNKQSKRTFK
jgi:MFS family permease